MGFDEAEMIQKVLVGAAMAVTAIAAAHGLIAGIDNECVGDFDAACTLIAPI
jgi:hypothetical protein